MIMKKVLVVEDEYLIRKGLLRGVDWISANCNVIAEAENGAEGIDMIRAFHPDIVICDIRMPIVDGLEMLRRTIREYRYKAIIVSGYGEFEYAQQAISIGVSHFLLKPIDFSELTELLREMAQDDFPEPQKTSDERYLQQMDRYLDTHYSEKVTLNDVCGALKISSTQLNTVLKRSRNVTFTTCLNRFRIGKAIDLLQHTDMKVYEIAEKTGFSNYKYFISVFNHYVGKSPLVYRKGERNGSR